MFLVAATQNFQVNAGKKLSSWRGPDTFILGTPPSERYSHGIAEALGRLFVFGGKTSSGALLNDIHQFDPLSLTWTDLSPEESLAPSARSEFAFAGAGETLFLFGGSGTQELLNDLHKFDPLTLLWTLIDSAGGAPPTPRHFHAMVAAEVAGRAGRGGEALYVFGGAGDSELLNDLHQLDLDTLVWTVIDSSLVVGTPPAQRHMHGLTATGGRLYIFGGSTSYGTDDHSGFGVPGRQLGLMNDLHSFDLDTLQWRELNPGTGLTRRSNLLSIVQPIPTEGPEGRLRRSRLSALAIEGSGMSVPANCAGHGFAAVGGRLYVFGGRAPPRQISGGLYSADDDVNDLYEFDPQRLQWTDLRNVSTDPPPSARHALGFAAVGGKLYVFGGVGSLTDPVNDLQQYDPASHQWTALVPGVIHGVLPSPRSAPGIAVINGSLYVFGGVVENLVQDNSLFQFDISLLRWRTLGLNVVIGTQPTIFMDFDLVAAADSLYIVGIEEHPSPGILSLYYFHAPSLTWSVGTQSGDIPTPRLDFRIASMKVENGDWRLYLFGGSLFSETESVNELFALDLVGMEWVKVDAIGALPPPRYGPGFTASNGKLFLFGGWNTAFLNDLYMFDPATLVWTSLGSDVVLGSPPPVRYNPGFAEANGRLFVFGGVWGTFHPVNLGDLFQFDPITLEWTAINSSNVINAPPTARKECGLASSGSTLFVFAGSTGIENLNDLYRLDVSKVVPWPKTAAPGLFLNVYDWDQIVVGVASDDSLHTRLVLCTGFYPCTMSLRGSGTGVLRVGVNGSIACLASEGCSRLSLYSVNLLCDHSELSPNSAMEVEGAALKVTMTSMVGCTSLVDGGCIQSYQGATVEVESSVFRSSYSSGQGGAISAVGSSLHVTGTLFENCSSSGGGGAVSAAGFACYGQRSVMFTTVNIISSAFQACTSTLSGGAVLASSPTSIVSVTSSVFSACRSERTGGALSSSDSARVYVIDCSFVNNSAYGFGGGALHVHDAMLSLHGISGRGNNAAGGGGGVLYWQGKKPPHVVPWCGVGMYPDPTFECSPTSCKSKCAACPAGTYQSGLGALDESYCTLCDAGKFASISGVPRCTDCSPGEYSTTLGSFDSETCTACEPGEYSFTLGGTACYECDAGTYSSSTASTTCQSCQGGTYSSSAGAKNREDCVLCLAGQYSLNMATRCLECSAGYYSGANATACIACDAGTYSTVSAGSGPSVCISCRAGSYSDTASTECMICEAGKFSSFTGCLPCEDGTISGPGYSVCLRHEMFRSGTAHSISASETTVSVNLPFTFPFYCSVYDKAHVSIDGFVGFGVQDSNDQQQNSESNRTFIAALWDHPNVIERSLLLTWSNADMITFQWTGLAMITIFGETTLTFQVSLYHNGTIILSYLKLSGAEISGDTATLGIEGSNAGIDLASFESGFCYRFLPGQSQCQNYELDIYECPKDIQLLPVCPSGLYLSADMSCAACPPGTYQTGQGMIHQGNCTLCDEGTFSPIAGASAPSACANCSGESGRGCETNHTTWIVYYRQSETPWQNRHNTSLASSTFLRPSNDFGARLDERKAFFTANDRQNEHEMCGDGNTALFGNCIGSSGQSLRLLNLPNAENPSWPGLSLPLTVMKLDAYNQTVVTDSASFVQLETTALLLGQTVVKLISGKGEVTVAVMPNFAAVIPSKGLTALSSEVFVHAVARDEETGFYIQSAVLHVPVATGYKICPRGYVLFLDSAQRGTCTYCQPRTYSVNPLYSLGIGNLPACLTCPPAAVCDGGAEVTFASGTWEESGGVYRLVGCPPRHALFDSISGVFSQDVQHCVPCAADEYVIDTNSSRFSCQPCPVGANCDGDTLVGLVRGSVWKPDISTGQYLLTSCPPGYELRNTFSGGGFSYAAQECSLCPASYFCLGGDIARRPCPASTFAPAGSNSSSTCMAAVFVVLTVGMPMASKDFDGGKQLRFRQAVAYASGAKVSQVTIVSTIVQRRAEVSVTGGVLVNAQIAAKDTDDAHSLRTSLNNDVLNNQLENQGLPSGTLLSVQVQDSSLQQAVSPWPAVGAAVGACALLVAGAAMLLLYLRHNLISPEEQLLRQTMAMLRVRLCITKRDGYLLSTERASFLGLRHRRQGGQCIIVQASYLEAAARLELFQEFDTNQFDALCLCLECGGENGCPDRAYRALGDWLLEISKELIRPSIPNAGRDASAVAPKACRLRVEERFPYFLRRICKARVWADAGGELFERLQCAAGQYMDDVAALCDARFEEMLCEVRGCDLVSFHSSPADIEGLVNIRRQDHPEIGAITVHEYARIEAELTMELGRVPSQSDSLGEEVFIAQLHRRAVLLNSDFQSHVMQLVMRHASASPDFYACPSAECCPEDDSDDHGSHSYRAAEDDDSRQTRAGPCSDCEGNGNASALIGFHPTISEARLESSATPSTLSIVGRAADGHVGGGEELNVAGLASNRRWWMQGQAGPTRSPSETFVTPPRRSTAHSMAAGVPSMEGSSSGHSLRREVLCVFSEGVCPLLVSGAAPKGVARMREKLIEYAADDAPWPLAASILDPVRASIVCRGPAQMLEVVSWFINPAQSGPSEGKELPGLPVCRIKNKFAMDKADLVGGYRDLMLCVIVHGSGGLRIIGEIQIHDRELYDLKMLMHKLYRIQRAHGAGVI